MYDVSSLAPKHRTTSPGWSVSSRCRISVNQLNTSGLARPVEIWPSTPPSDLIAGLLSIARRSA